MRKQWREWTWLQASIDKNLEKLLEQVKNQQQLFELDDHPANKDDTEDREVADGEIEISITIPGLVELIFPNLLVTTLRVRFTRAIIFSLWIRLWRVQNYNWLW